MDDIIISTKISPSILDDALNQLKTASIIAGLQFNESKTQGPASRITAFNIHISKGILAISDERMAEFKIAIKTGSDSKINGIISYVNSVNRAQANSFSL